MKKAQIYFSYFILFFHQANSTYLRQSNLYHYHIKPDTAEMSCNKVSLLYSLMPQILIVYTNCLTAALNSYAAITKSPIASTMEASS